MNTLTNLGTMTCDMCGDTCECFDVGSAGYPEARCTRCYADGVGHGQRYNNATDAFAAAQEALPVKIGSEEMRLIAAYY